MASLLVGGGAPAAYAGSCYTGPFPFTNNVAQPCIEAINTSFSGSITNNASITAGAVTPTKTGISVNNSTINGAVANQGTISALSFQGSGIRIFNNAVVTGGVGNSGTITAGAFGIGIAVTGVSTFAGGISNAGTISAGLVGIAAGTEPFGSISTFTGNIANSGTISAFGTDIAVAAVQTFIGNISNSGTLTAFSRAGISVTDAGAVIGNIGNSGMISAATGIVVGCACGISTFAGSISNGGTITASRVGVWITNVGSFGTSTVGGITNSGSILVHQSAGIWVDNIGAFFGNISNSGTIAVAGFGVVVGSFSGPFGGSVSNFAGSIINNGKITANSAGILVDAVSTFAGNISNNGTITARLAGIAVSSVTQFGSNSAGGGIVNSGTISAGHIGTGINLFGISTFVGGVTNSGLIDSGRSGIQIQNIQKFIGDVSNSGVIIAGRTGIFICNCVTLAGGGITNTGTISAAEGIVVHNFSPVSIFDSGTITGSIAAIDLRSASGGNTLTLGPGFSFPNNSRVLGFGNDTFQLGGTGNGSFDLSTIGTQITGFTTFNVTSGVWIVSNAAPVTWTVMGGTLAGTGTLGGLTINNGAILQPGTIGVPGTSMTITGNLTFSPGATYIVSINGTTSTLVNANGVASLAGAVQGNLLPGIYTNKPIVILDPGTVTGTFSGFTSNEPGFSGSLSYTPNDVLLTLNAQLGAGGGLDTNQQNVANGINNYFNNGGTLPANFFPLFGQIGATLGNSLTQLDGEVAADSEKGAFELVNEFLGLMLDPFVYGRGGAASGGGPLGFAPDRQASFPPDVALAYAGLLKAPPPSRPSPARGGGLGWGFDQRWTVWGAGFGGSGRANGDPAIGSNNVATSTYGFAAGADYHVSPDTILGFAVAGSGTNWSLAQSLGTGRSDAFQAGIYGTRYLGPAYLSAALAFTNNWFTTNRIAAAGDQLTASFNGQSLGARLEAGYRLTLPSPVSGGGVGLGLGVTPYAAIQAQDFHTPTYSETDLTGGGFGLTYSATTASDTRSELGARFDALTAFGAMPVQFRARLAWAHDWVSNTALSAAFQALPGSSFVVNGAAVPANSALTSVGAELHLTPHWTLVGKFDGEFATSAQTYAGSGTLRYRW